MKYMSADKFDSNKPTSQMLGRFQPWHDSHTELFKRMHAETGQVVIMVRDMPQSDDNPFNPRRVVKMLVNKLARHDFEIDKDYSVIIVPNIVNIGYGRDVGYSIQQYDLGEEAHKISATDLRDIMRAAGDI